MNQNGKCALTTFDNPYNPFTQFSKWFLFDTEKGYNSCAYLGRIARTSEEWSSTSATGATTSRLTIVASAYRNGYKYRCVITDGHGNSITSLPAVLTITA